MKECKTTTGDENNNKRRVSLIQIIKSGRLLSELTDRERKVVLSNPTTQQMILEQIDIRLKNNNKQ